MSGDIILETKITPALVRKIGQGGVTIAAGEWLQIRHGNISSPVVDLQEQCPPGKIWHGKIEIYLSEQDE